MRAHPSLTILLCAAALFGMAGCAKLKQPGPTPAEPSAGVHPPGFADTTKLDVFHGTLLKQRNWDVSACAGCHGANFEGGTARVSCFACHASVPHRVRFAQTGGHPGYLRDRFFPLGECKRCHGEQYAGGSRVNISCMRAGCHADQSGTAKSPEACNTCHGEFRAPASDFRSAAPPKSVAGDTSWAVHNVGAHQAHLRAEGVRLGSPVRCGGCHSVPSSVTASGHIDAGPAEVSITAALALTPTDGITPAPAYDNTAYTCSGTYCHGNFRVRKPTLAEDPSGTRGNVYLDSVILGGNTPVRWTDGPSGAVCGSCHALPPTGHREFAGTFCSGCHVGVTEPGANAIADTTKHMNGLIDVFGSQRPF